MSKKQVQLDASGNRKFSIRDCVAYAAGDLGRDKTAEPTESESV